MRWIKGIIYFVVVIVLLWLGILFALRNQQLVALDIFWFKLPAASLALWIALALIIGMLIGILIMLSIYWRKAYQLKRCRQLLANHQQSLSIISKS